MQITVLFHVHLRGDAGRSVLHHRERRTDTGFYSADVAPGLVLAKAWFEGWFRREVGEWKCCTKYRALFWKKLRNVGSGFGGFAGPGCGAPGASTARQRVREGLPWEERSDGAGPSASKREPVWQGRWGPWRSPRCSPTVTGGWAEPKL